LGQLRIVPSLNKAFSKSGVGPLVCLVLRIHAIAGISNALAIPQNREQRTARIHGEQGYSGGGPKKDTGLR
jgi:hypothetical protein